MCTSQDVVTPYFFRPSEVNNHLHCCRVCYPHSDCWCGDNLEMEREQSAQTTINDPAAGRTVQDEQGSPATCATRQQSLQESDSAARSSSFPSTQSDHAQTSAT